MAEWIYLNGKFVPDHEAVIAYNDRGFQFADGVYEVIKYYKGIPFRFPEHLTRLQNSLGSLSINFTQTDTLRHICQDLIHRNSLTDRYSGVYIQITRGSCPRSHAFPEKITPTVCINSFLFEPRKENLIHGISTITRPDIRWLKCNIKSIALLPNVLLMQEAAKLGAQECILFREGKITEATRSNVLGVINGKVVTHPDSALILPGITKGAVKDICIKHRIGFVEEPIAESELAGLDELFLAGTGNEITPVISVNDTPFSTGRPGPLTRLIQQHLFEMTYLELAHDNWWKSYR